MAVTSGFSSSRPVKHHFLPISYLNLFAAADEHLGVFDSQSQTCKRLHPKITGCENDLYTIFDIDGTAHSYVEEALCKVDGSGVAAIRALEIPQSTTAIERENLALYLGILKTRMPTFQRSASTPSGAAFQHFFAPHLANFTAKHTEGKCLSREQLSAIEKEVLDAACDKSMTMELMLRVGESIGDDLLRRNWLIWKTSDTYPFVTCDNPVFGAPAPPDGDGSGSINRTELFLMCPLSKTRFLVCGDYGSGWTTRALDSRGVDLHNRYVRASMDRFLYATTREDAARIAAYPTFMANA